jgi:hypothetical protein
MEIWISRQIFIFCFLGEILEKKFTLPSLGARKGDTREATVPVPYHFLNCK